jgi:hypothetical protein
MFSRLAATFACGAALAGLVGLAGVALAACGPSFQVVYEGDARFEHCYAIDDTPTVSMQEKTDCWTQWMKSYRYGQTRNRVDYAAMRANALQEAHVAPTDEAVMSAAPGGGIGNTVGVDEPVTTNAFATPPKTMNAGDGGHDAGQPEKSVTVPVGVAAAGSTSSSAPEAPGEGCADSCHTTWQTCRGPCKGHACGACDKSYSRCMKKCF